MPGAARRTLLVVLLCAATGLAHGPAQTEERRISGEDTSRHPERDETHLAPGPNPAPAPDRTQDATQLRAAPPPPPARSPAEAYYWSDKCVQQRASGWGHTGDCDNPAYGSGRVYRPRRWQRDDRSIYPPYRPRGGIVIERGPRLR